MSARSPITAASAATGSVAYGRSASDLASARMQCSTSGMTAEAGSVALWSTVEMTMTLRSCSSLRAGALAHSWHSE